MFSMATRIFPVETIAQKLSAETQLSTLTARFGSVVLSVIVDYIVFFRIAPSLCLQSSIEWYAFFAIYLFNLASAKLHCLRNIRIFTSEIYIARDDITTIFTISSTADVLMSIERAFALIKVLPIILVWSKKTSRYDHFGAEILRYRARISVG